MTATVFPAYGLARMVVPKWYALAAAGASVAVPALAYSPILVEEPLAYPLSTLGAVADRARARAADVGTDSLQPSAYRVVAAAHPNAARDPLRGARTRAALARVAVETRAPVAHAVDAVGLGRSRDPRARRRVRARGGDGPRIDCVAQHDAPLQGPDLRARELGDRRARDRRRRAARSSQGSPRWRGRRREPRDPRTRAFVVTSVAALVVFLAYAGIKGAYISTVFATLVVERNLIYLCPILFIATALAFARGVGRGLGGRRRGDLHARRGRHDAAPSRPVPLLRGARARRSRRSRTASSAGPEGTIEAVLVAACVVALRRRRRAQAPPTAVARLRGRCRHRSRRRRRLGADRARCTRPKARAAFSETIDRNLPKPYDWVEEATGGDPSSSSASRSRTRRASG